MIAMPRRILGMTFSMLTAAKIAIVLRLRCKRDG